MFYGILPAFEGGPQKSQGSISVLLQLFNRSHQGVAIKIDTVVSRPNERKVDAFIAKLYYSTSETAWGNVHFTGYKISIGWIMRNLINGPTHAGNARKIRCKIRDYLGTETIYLEDKRILPERREAELSGPQTSVSVRLTPLPAGN